MFRGSVPLVVQQIITETVKGWNASEVFVGCSGNFTIERALASVGQIKLHGNDVTLYSSIVGAYLASQSFRCDLKPVSGLKWLQDYMGSPEEKIATVMLSMNLLAGLSAQGEEKENFYYQRIKEAFQKSFPILHKKTVDHIQSVSVKLASYHCGDVVEWIKQVPKDKPFITYPPFANVGAASQYARDTKKLNMLFDWDEPSYPMLDGDRLADFYETMSDREFWAFGTNRPVEKLKPYLNGMTKLTNRGTIVYLYHSSGPKRIVTPRQELEGMTVERLKPGQEIGNNLSIAELSYKQFQAVRSQYMNIGIRPGSATLAIGVMVDGYLVGVYAFSASPHPGQNANPTSIYLLSDFPVAPTDYPRLSKLVLYATLSKESKLLAERITRHRIRSIFTTAFTNNPVSMKYRGLFDLYSRKENPTKEKAWGTTIDTSSNEYYARKYELNYTADMGLWTLAEGLALWKQKHGKRIANANSDNND